MEQQITVTIVTEKNLTPEQITYLKAKVSAMMLEDFESLSYSVSVTHQQGPGTKQSDNSTRIKF